MRWPSRSPSVHMVQAAQDRPGDHLTRRLRGRRDRTLEPEAAMWSVPVVVVSKFAQDCFQVALIHHDDVVKTFRPNGSHDPLANSVRPRRPRRRAHASDAEVDESLIKVAAVIGIPVMDQKLRLPTEGRRLQHLAPDPGGGRAGRDVEVNPFPSIMAEQEEYIEDAVTHRLDHEEIGGPDAAQLVAQEGPPALVVTWPDSAPLPPPRMITSNGRASERSTGFNESIASCQVLQT